MKILHIIPYQEFYPPKNGGALRCYHILNELARFSEVTVLTLQDKETIEFDISVSENIEIINPLATVRRKGFLYKIKSALIYRYFTRSIRKSADIIFLKLYRPLIQALRSRDFDYVIYEHLESLAFSTIVSKSNKKIISILDHHNVDHLLIEQEYNLKENKIHLKHYNRVKYEESTLYKKMDSIFACSKRDCRILEEINVGKIKALEVPNGVDVEAKEYCPKIDFKSPDLIFCGDLSTPANTDALLWIYSSIWPLLKRRIENVRLCIVGRNGVNPAYDPLKNEKDISFIGEVDDLKAYYNSNSLSMVPLRIGSGTRLKILEAMCYGNLVISTSKGAEGIEYTDGENILIADDEDAFVEKIEYVLRNPERAQEMSKKARTFVENTYSWKTIGENVRNYLKND